MKTYKQKVLENFEAIDIILATIPKDSILFHYVFSIRSQYSVYTELTLMHGFFTKRAIRKILGWICFGFLSIFVNCFREIVVTDKEDVVLLGNWRFDISLSKELNIKQLKYKSRFTIQRLFNIKLLLFEFCFLMKTIFVLRKLKKTNLLFSLYSLFTYSLCFNTIDLSGLKVLVGANDLSSLYYAFWHKAKILGIKRVHIEYVQINSISANNVFADYYYYPSSLHFNIRKKCPQNYNKDLEYIKGGYLNTDYLQYAKQRKITTQHPEVTYITSHSYMFVNDDLFYINEILKHLPDDYRLNIKVHPYDNLNRYNHFLSHPKVTIFSFKEITNPALIARSSMLFSICSALSLEAKFLCNKSYYLNYDAYSDVYSDYYDELSPYMDVITTDQQLKNIFKGVYENKSFELFKSNVNMTYPNTFEHFKVFINKLKNDESIGCFVQEVNI